MQTSQAIKASQVSFSVCRPGAVIEFEVFEGKPVQGTVECLRFAGARNFLVVLSKVVDHEGTVRPGFNPSLGMPEAINLSHAKRVVAHGTGDLVWDKSCYALETVEKELAIARKDGSISRRGQKLVIDGYRQYAPNLARWLVHRHIVENATMLGKLPWDVLDIDAMNKELERVGIMRYHRQGQGAAAAYFPTTATIDRTRLTRFLRQRLNHFKCKLSVQAREDERLDAEAYARDYDEDLMSAY